MADGSDRKGLLGLCTICVSAFLIFLSYNSMQNLESSVNKGDGTTAVGVIYLAIICATPLAPRVMGTLGRKWALVLSACTYVAFIASNLYPVWQVMIPAAVVLGTGGAVLWPTILSLLKNFSELHARSRGADEGKCLDHFSSAFWGSFQFAQLTGSLMIFLIIRKGGEDASKAETLLAIVYTGCSALGCFLIFALLEDVDKGDGEPRGEGEGDGDKDGGGLRAVVDRLVEPKSLLLAGVYFYNGIEQSFAWCVFTSEMVLPAFGGNEAMIGILMLTYAGVDAAVGSLAAQLPSTKRTTRIAIAVAIVLQCAGVLGYRYLLLDSVPALYASAVALGAGDALLNTKIGVLLGLEYGKGGEHRHMVTAWRGVTALGCALPFFLSGHTGLDFNVWLLAGSGLVGLAMFAGSVAEEEGEGEGYAPI